MIDINDELVDRVLSIYLSGYFSGAATALAGVAGLPDNAADKLAHGVASQVADDQSLRAAARQFVVHGLLGASYENQRIMGDR